MYYNSKTKRAFLTVLYSELESYIQLIILVPCYFFYYRYTYIHNNQLNKNKIVEKICVYSF